MFGISLCPDGVSTLNYQVKGRTFLQTFKVSIQVLWCEKNTASHKKVHILDWKLMAHT